ncbi:MAG: hypothetical protein HY396_01140 [Candidatus Doudnabacteria bacterium]|nr:hypothetical protein [Candidatus Doudnabacteria bacterium]
MIDQKLIEKNKKRLLAEKARLLGLLSRIAKRDKVAGDFRAEYPEFGSKEDENAAEVTAYEANLAEEWDLEQKLTKVEKALKRIEKGTYGICAKGGEEMPLKRLEVAPEAENCVEHDESK